LGQGRKTPSIARPLVTSESFYEPLRARFGLAKDLSEDALCAHQRTGL
jgi:hypothetical protein